MTTLAFKELIPQVQQGNCVLFLGAGSTIACESPSGGGVTGDGLARALVQFLGEDPSNFSATLMEAGEFVEARHPRHRNALDEFIYERLHDLRPTLGHLLMTLFPWRAIVTTNYNQVVESGYTNAQSLGLTQTWCVPCRTDEEVNRIGNLSSGQIPLFKPHGCLSIRGDGEAPMVLTAKDYYNSTHKRQKMYSHITHLATRFSTLFVGYSLVDYNFNNLYYELQQTLGDYLVQSYSVIPIPSHKAGYLERVYQRRDITLIDDKFDTFMVALAEGAGLLAGSVLETTIQELSRTNVVQRLGSYSRTLPLSVASALSAKGIAIP